MTENPPHSPDENHGGKQGIQNLVTLFYDLTDSEHEAMKIRNMHPASLTGSRQKLLEFLSGFLGSPSIYLEKHGHPPLRMCHHPFAIDSAAKHLINTETTGENNTGE